MTTAPFIDRDSLLTWLDALPASERVHVARLLADTHTIGDLAAAADATIYAMTRTASQAAVAAELRLSAKQVKRAVERHAARLRTETARPANA